MEQYVVLGQKDVLFHGIWKAQSTVSESLIRTIAANLAATPARECKLVLTSAGLRLFMLDGKREQTHQVSFDAIRDVFPNHFYRKCLLIIYANNTDKLSVMACCSDNVKDIDTISKAYGNYKQQLQRYRIRSDPQVSQTRTEQEKPRFSSEGHRPGAKDTIIQTKLSNGAVYETLTNSAVMGGRDSYGSSQKSEVSSRSLSSSTSDSTEIEDVFIDSRSANLVQEPEVFIREPMTRVGKRVAFNLGVQTLPINEDTDTESINSASSIKTLEDDMNVLTQEARAVKVLLEKSAGISLEQYHRRTDKQGNQKSTTSHQNAGSSFDNPSHPKDRHVVAPADGHNEDYDQRSVGIQTVQSSKPGRRYFKKQVKPTTSNANKEKIEALRKRSTSAGPRSPSSNGPEPESTTVMLGLVSNSPTLYTSLGTGQARNHFAQASHSPANVNNTLVAVSSTVVKPIENVYAGRAGRRPDTTGRQVKHTADTLVVRVHEAEELAKDRDTSRLTC